MTSQRCIPAVMLIGTILPSQVADKEAIWIATFDTENRGNSTINKPVIVAQLVTNLQEAYVVTLQDIFDDRQRVPNLILDALHHDGSNWGLFFQRISAHAQSV